MHILITNNLPIPALKYGGTERVIWWLGKELVRRGHKVSYLVPGGSSCPFAEILPYNSSLTLSKQIPDHIDIIHSNFGVREELPKPFMVTMHGYVHEDNIFDRNTVFVSKRHAELHGSSAFVHNGLDPEEYGEFDSDLKRSHLLFLAAIGRGVKNLRGAKYIAKKAGKKLAVIGGRRFHVSPNIRYYGRLGGEAKNAVLKTTSALLFPVVWDEPFGLATIEALYHGAPVIGTPYGALPEIVTDDTGVLSASMQELIAAAKDHSKFSRRHCHELVMEKFTSMQMTDHYLQFYEKVLNGEPLNAKAPHRTHESLTTPHPIHP